MFTCPKKDVNVHPARIEATCGQDKDSPTIFSLLERHYHYKAVTVQIPSHTLAKIFLPTEDESVHLISMRPRQCGTKYLDICYNSY